MVFIPPFGRSLVGLIKYSEGRFSISTFTKDMTAATGDTSYTGTGFTPKAIILLGVINATFTSSHGFAIAGSSGCIANDAANVWTWDNGVAYLQTAAGARQVATLKSMDANGFTLTWTKTGSPTGTANLYYLAFR